MDIWMDNVSYEYYILDDDNIRNYINNDWETEECKWVIADREDLIDRLINRISETNSDKELMKVDLKYLIKLEDQYIFSSTTTNEYVAKSDDVKWFEDLCKDFIYYLMK